MILKLIISNSIAVALLASLVQSITATKLNIEKIKLANQTILRLLICQKIIENEFKQATTAEIANTYSQLPFKIISKTKLGPNNILHFKKNNLDTFYYVVNNQLYRDEVIHKAQAIINDVQNIKITLINANQIYITLNLNKIGERNIYVKRN